MNVERFKAYWPFIVFATVIFAAIFAIEKINERFWLNDFRVYYSAAQALVNGAQVYGIPFGLDTGFYKYSPFVAILFVPYTFFSYETASIIHYFVLCASAIFTLIILGRLIRRYFLPVTNKTENILMSLALVCILLHLIRELHLGNINMLLLFLVSTGLIFSLRSKDILAGIFIGLAIIIKPYFLILVLPFLASGKWKTFISILAAVAVSFLIPMFIFDYGRNILLHKEWIDSMREHSGYLSSNHTIQSLLHYYSGWETGKWFSYFLIGAIGAGYFLFFFLMKKKITESPEEFFFVTSYFCLVAVIPNLVITDTEHFLLSLPLIMILLSYVYEKKNYLVTAAFIMLIFFYEGNSTDLLGKNLSQRFEEMGLLGISNLVLIASILILSFSAAKKTIQVHRD